MYASAHHGPAAHSPALFHPPPHAVDPPVPQQPQTQAAPQQPQQPAQPPKDPVSVVGIPSVEIQNNKLVVGSAQTSSTRSYTLLKVLGDGSFGTVWLCDWHGTLPPHTPLSPMQCGAGARPEWVGKRLVAVKRMKKKWEGGWNECRKLKELESLRVIPFHPNIIPLYDFFLLPDTKELYFVFESMEGNLYHLVKARKGRPFAGGLVSSIFRQIVAGLDHIHSSGYFHRDMKPENVLVTTTGLFNYNTVSPIANPSAKERDVVAIIKLADFGLARETKSKPPYTEYVSTRWYRAPEVLLLSRDYSNPVDMWAVGTIMAELVNLRPIFPGADQVDQVARICEILGDPSDSYGRDGHGAIVGGGAWPKGIKLAKAVGFQFPKIPPRDIFELFERSVPISLICCIRDLLRYDPEKRLTSRQCLQHEYLQETTPRNPNIPIPSGLRVDTSTYPTSAGSTPQTSLFSRNIPPRNFNHRSSQISDGSSSHGLSLPVAGAISHTSSSTNSVVSPEERWGDAEYAMDTSGTGKPATEVQASPMVQEYPARPRVEPAQPLVVPAPVNKLGKLGGLSFGKKTSKWGLSMFGGEKSLPPVDEVPTQSSLKRTKSNSTDSKSLRSDSPSREPAHNHGPEFNKKFNKKEAERLQREAEKQRRLLAEKMHREQARAVMQKRHQMIKKTAGDNIEWSSAPVQTNGIVGGSHMSRTDSVEGPTASIASAGRAASDRNWISGASSSTHQSQNRFGTQSEGSTISDRDHDRRGQSLAMSATVNAATGRYPYGETASLGDHREWRSKERVAKARRREHDDDHSMSSSEVQSVSRMSTLSYATVDTDPGPSIVRGRQGHYMSRVTSVSSLRTSFDDFSTSGRSSNSFSLEGQMPHDLRGQVPVNANHLKDGLSPPPMHMLTLSPSASPSMSPSTPWMHIQQQGNDSLSPLRKASPPFISMPPLLHVNPNGNSSPVELHNHLHGLPSSPYGHPPSSYGNPPSTGNTQRSETSVINPIFKVPPIPPPSKGQLMTNTLPPFSQLEAVAGGEYAP